MQLSIIHNDREINFTVELRNRRTTTIQVHRDRSVRVLAPKFSSKRSIMKLVKQRADWILKKQQKFGTLPQQKNTHNFLDGDWFKYLGDDYELKVTSGHAGVEIGRAVLKMSAPESYSAEQRKKVLQKWYRKQSEQIFSERFVQCMKAAAAIGIKNAPEWKSRILKRSWGSCSTGGNINLNIELVSAPLPCIDYVILHELCHLIEHNHSPRFYKLMDRVCPDWRSRRKELNEGYETRLV